MSLWISYITGSVIFIFFILIFLMNFFIKPYYYLKAMNEKIIQIFHSDKLKLQFKQNNNMEKNLLEVYPGKGIIEIKRIAKDSSGYSIDPTREYAAPYRSRYVNVSKEGYRIIKNQKEFSYAKNQRNIFIFGGSTTWGYRLPDNETIASYVQSELDRRSKKFIYNVFNYGICSGYSKDEKRFFERLIINNRIPHYAIFIGGLNDFCRVALRWPGETNKNSFLEFKIIKKYLFDPYFFWRGEFLKLFGISPKMSDCLIKYDEKSIEDAGRELIFNWRAIRGISNEYDIKCIFVLQPISVYDYPLEKNLFLSEDDLKKERSYYLAANKGYRLLLRSDMLNSFTFLDLHKLQIKGYEYVDSCHYSSDFSKRIAESLTEEILKDNDFYNIKENDAD